ncbi:MAG: glycosyltransferase [Candidatus Omnitrophota bacterium]
MTNEIEELKIADGSTSEPGPMNTYRLASALKRLNCWTEATDWFLKLIEGNAEPELRSGAYFHVGEIHWFLNHRDTALGYFKKCLELDPGHRKARQYLDGTAPETDNASIARPLPSSQAARTPFPEVHASPLKILFIQNSPCIRNYKYASALRKKGYPVTLAYTTRKLSECYQLTDEVYKASIKLESTEQLIALCREFDIIHCHNDPDILTLGAIQSGMPVIHDTHDLISLRNKSTPTGLETSILESLAQKGATGCIYTTPEKADISASMYHLNDKPVLVVDNYCSEDDIPAPEDFLPKRSKQDGHIHIVYEGGLATSGIRDFMEIFPRLVRHEHIHVHVFPVDNASANTATYCQLARYFPRLHLYPPVSPNDLIRVMTQFDVGIIPFTHPSGNFKKFLDTTIANKLYEYMAAGLPVVTADIQSYRRFFSEHPTGFVYQNEEEIIEKLPQLLEKNASVDFSNYVFTYEKEIDKVIRFYHTVIAYWKTKKTKKDKKNVMGS